MTLLLTIIAYTCLAGIVLCGVVSVVHLIRWTWNAHDDDKDMY